MDEFLSDNTHTKEGAETFLELVLSSAKLKFDQRGSVGSSSLLLLTVNPQTGAELPCPAVAILDGSDTPIDVHEAKVQHYAKTYKAIGVLTIFEAWAVDTETFAELADSDEVNQLLAACRDGYEEDAVLAELERASGRVRTVVVEFEHLRFTPRTRIWTAATFSVEDTWSLGDFEEAEDPTPTFGGFLQFYD